MSIQKLEYKHKDIVAVDEAGNFVTDTAGNLVNAIPPIIISPAASFSADTGIQGKSCWYGSIEYGGNTYDWSGCTDNGDSNPVRIETKGFLLRFVNRGSEGFAAVTNLRNLAKVHDSLTVNVYAGNNFEPVIKKVSETEEFITYSTEYDATLHGISVRWGDQSIEDGGYHCPGGDYYVGSVTINFSDLSVTLNTDDVTWKSGTFKCGEIWDEPIGPNVIHIKAPYAWCADQDSRPGDTGEYFTESRLPILEISYIWRNMYTVVKVEENETEAEALAAAAFGVVASVEMRDYIVGGTQYWRSPKNDVIIGEGYKKRLMVYGTVIYGRDDNYNNHEFVEKDLWVEQNSTIPFPNETTKRIFKKAYYGTGDPENPAEYELNKCLLSDKPKNYVNTEDVGISTIFYRRVSSDGGAIFAYGYAKKTGNSVSLVNPNMPDLPAEVFDEYEVFDGSEKRWISGFSTGYTAALPGKPYWVKDEDSGVYIIKPDNHDEFGQTHPVTRRYGRVFLHDDGYYYASARTSDDYGLNGYVYEFDTLKAWTVSPCASAQISVYTDMESPAVDDDYYFYDKDSKVKSFAGKIVQVGNSAYSITDKNGVKYYFKEDRAQDEEFE